MKRTPLKRKTTLRSRAAKPKAVHRERTAHLGRMKRKATDMNALEAFHVERVRKLPCLIQGNRIAGAAHHLMKAPGKRCRRDHQWVVPLSPEFHNMGSRSVHALATEEAFEREHGLAPGFLIDAAKRLWEESCAAYS